MRNILRERESDKASQRESTLQQSEGASEKATQSERERERVVGVGFGFVKEFSAPLLTLTKCFWPPQLQQAPPLLLLLLLSLLLSRNRSWCGCPLPQPPAPAAPFWLGSCQLICIIALYLFAAPSLRSCCSPTQLGLAHSLSHTHSPSLSHWLLCLCRSCCCLCAF